MVAPTHKPMWRPAAPMPPKLEAARVYARRGDWHALLGLRFNASADDIRKARRRLQLGCHADKGGSGELSQLINRAADELLERCPEVRAQRERERAREAQEELARQEEERRRREEEREREREAYFRRLEEQRAERDRRAHRAALAAASTRTHGRKAVYLSRSTARVFDCLRIKLDALQSRRAFVKARGLAYAAEAEIAARRAVRECKFPKTAGLHAREPLKAQRLAALKEQYDRAYQRLRYVLKAGLPRRCATLTVSRLLREAWGVLLAQPAPLPDDGDVIPMGAA